jgi:hypothetical protein
MQDPHLDLYSVASMLLALAVGPQFAPALAAYIIIALGALVGTLPALKQRDPSNSASAIVFVLVLSAWSFGLTFGTSLVIQHYTGIGWQWFLFPVSFGISAMGDRWLQAPGLLWGLVLRAISAWVPSKGGQP